MGLLQSLTIKYQIDLSDVTTGTRQLKDSVTSTGDVVSAMSDVFQLASENMAESLGKPIEQVKAIQSAAENAASGTDSSMSEIAESAQFAADVVKTLSGAADGSKIITNADVAQANLTLIEAKVAEARTQLQTLQNAANAGESVTGIDVAQANLTLLEAKAQEARSNLASLGEQAEETGGQLTSGLNVNFDGVIGLGAKLGGTIFALQTLGQTAISVAQGLLSPAEQSENTTEALTNLLGSSQKATSELQQLNTFAAKTQFPTADIDTTAESLIGFGIHANDVIPIMRSLGDALSAVGKGTPAELQQVTNIIGKISTQGKITQADITELGAHGINALQAIATGAGLSTTAVQQMIANGTLPAKQAIDDLTKGIEKNPMLSGGMAKQSDTLSGKMSTLTSDFNQFLSAIVSPALPGLESEVGKLTTDLSSPSFKEFAKTVGQDIVGGLKNLKTGFNDVVSTGKNVTDFFKNNQTAMDALDAVLLSVAGGIVGVVIPAMVAWAISMIPVAIETMLTIGPYILVGAVVAAVIFGVIEAIQHWSDIMSFLGGICGDVGSFVGSVFSGLGTFLHNVIGKIGDGFSSFGTLMHNIWNGVVSTVKGAINWIIGDINSFIGFIDGIQIHIPAIGVGPVQTPAFNWDGLGIPKIPKLSTGGFVAPGTFAIAGDPGPNSELVYGGRAGATVFSHSQSQAILGGSGGGNAPIVIPIYMDSEQIAEYTVDPVTRTITKKLFGFGPVKEAA